PAVEPHTELTCRAIGLPHVRFLQSALEGESRQHATSGMILMSDRCTKERHKPITEELINGAFVPMDLIEGEFEEPIQQGMHMLGTKAFGNRGRVRQVTEEDGDLFPFPFEGTAGGQNFFGKVSRSIGQGLSFMCCGWSRDKCWGFRDRGRRCC